jgi:hypothetical protein
MASDMTAQQEYFELYKVALAQTHRQDYNGQMWADAAADIAKLLMTKARLPTAAAQAPTMPGVLPEAAPVGHRFGPAFLGWDEAALTQTLVAVQAVVLCMEFNGSPEQLAVEQGNLNAAIKHLFDIRIEQKMERAKKAAAGQ